LKGIGVTAYRPAGLSVNAYEHFLGGK